MHIKESTKMKFHPDRICNKLSIMDMNKKKIPKPKLPAKAQVEFQNFLEIIRGIWRHRQIFILSTMPFYSQHIQGVLRAFYNLENI